MTCAGLSSNSAWAVAASIRSRSSTARMVRWRGTLLTDQNAGYDTAKDPRVHPGRVASGCVVRARRKFDQVSLNHWTQLSRHLDDGDVPLDDPDY